MEVRQSHGFSSHDRTVIRPIQDPSGSLHGPGLLGGELELLVVRVLANLSRLGTLLGLKNTVQKGANGIIVAAATVEGDAEVSGGCLDGTAWRDAYLQAHVTILYTILHPRQ